MPPRLLPLIVATALAAGLCGAAEAQTKPPPKKPAARMPAPPPTYAPADPMKTSDQVKRESVQGAVTTPLRDLNVTRTDIPDILLQAMTDPYARPSRNAGCRTLVAMVRPLDDVLGPDIDQIPPDPASIVNRGTALGTAADVATGALIPFRGVVRTLSGAESHDKLVQAAIVAGHTRRAYLKGLGEAKGCLPPATPTHERAGSPPANPKRVVLTPKYPTRAPADQQTSAGTPQTAAPKPRT
jgi:hypothetical protein